MIQIRQATVLDLDRIVAIYNQAILTTTSTFDTDPKTIEQQRPWFDKHSKKYPLIVALIEDRVVGWASLTPWSDRCAYSETAELSVYIDEAYRGKGIGKELMVKIIEAGEQAKLHTIISRIAEGNEISVRMHKQAGFEVIGTMKEVGRKFGKLLDVLLMQKVY